MELAKSHLTWVRPRKASHLFRSWIRQRCRHDAQKYKQESQRENFEIVGRMTKLALIHGSFSQTQGKACFELLIQNMEIYQGFLFGKL